MTSMSWLRRLFGACSLLTAIGCSGNPAAGPDTGQKVTVAVPEEQRDAYQAAKAALASARPGDADAFLKQWTPLRLAKLSYDPAAAVNLAAVQASNLRLNAAEMATLTGQGFVITGRQSFPTFFDGYRNIYVEDLPVFVSADAVLHAVHRSYDSLLMSIETATLIPKLKGLLQAMQAALPARAALFPPETVADVDEYLTVARGLLGEIPNLAVSGSIDTVRALVSKAQAAQGIEDVMLFGELHGIDFSQFTPRGHYADAGTLQHYFQASMWLGRIDLRLLTQDKQGGIRFHRRPYAAATLLADLVADQTAAWQIVDDTLRGFVGESDNMLPTDFARLQQDLGAASLAATLANTDDQIAQAIISGGYGIQRIASQLLFVESGNEGAPLDRTFLLLGQRFVIDSQVLSNVVYDRIKSLRLMPNPLDVAFAALGNADAAGLLRADLIAYPDYVGALHDARTLVDQHEPAFWQKSLYGNWMSALRAMSPPADLSSPALMGLPSVVGTDAWSRRVLQTQLGSWTELRHDNLLYAKQSYTGIPACSFPDAYVEPVPALWGALADFAKRGQELTQTMSNDAVGAYFSSLAATTTMLKGMAEAQLTGTPFTAEQMAFINNAIEYKDVSVVCTTVKRPAGWYPQLFFSPDDADKQDTIVADVHTQPADEGGNPVGKVLHVGTGYPRLMVATFETCEGPRAYAGMVSSYFETITQDFMRLTDAEWTTMLAGATPVPWQGAAVMP
jgi:hypothetical protein